MKLTFVDSEMSLSWKKPEYALGPFSCLQTDELKPLREMDCLVLCVKVYIFQLPGYTYLFHEVIFLK